MRVVNGKRAGIFHQTLIWAVLLSFLAGAGVVRAQNSETSGAIPQSNETGGAVPQTDYRSMLQRLSYSTSRERYAIKKLIFQNTDNVEAFLSQYAQDKDPAVCIGAFDLLGESENLSCETIHLLVRQFHSPESKIASAAARALSQHINRLPEGCNVDRRDLVQFASDQLRKPYGFIRYGFFDELLGAIGPEALSAVPLLVELGAKTPNSFVGICKNVGLIIESTTEPIPEVDSIVTQLMAVVQNSEIYVAEPAAILLGKIGSPAERAAPVLYEYIEQPRRKELVKGILGMMSMSDDELFPYLEGFNTENGVMAVLRVAPPDEEKITMLLHHPDKEVCENAESLLLAGPIVRNASRLADQLIQSATIERCRAVAELARIATPECTPDEWGIVIPALLKATDDPEPFVRYKAIVGLIPAVTYAETIAPVIMNRLSDKDTQVRKRAVGCLTRFQGAGLEDEVIYSALSKVLHDEDPWIRYWAASTSLKMHPTPDAETVLVELIGHQDEKLASKAFRELCRYSVFDAENTKRLLQEIRTKQLGDRRWSFFYPLSTEYVNSVIQFVQTRNFNLDDSPRVYNVRMESILILHDALFEFAPQGDRHVTFNYFPAAALVAAGTEAIPSLVDILQNADAGISQIVEMFLEDWVVSKPVPDYPDYSDLERIYQLASLEVPERLKRIIAAVRYLRGDRSSETIEELRKSLQEAVGDQHQYGIKTIAMMVNRVGGESDLFLHGLSAEDADLFRIYAESEPYSYKPNSERVIPLLLNILKQGSEKMRQLAFDTLSYGGVPVMVSETVQAVVEYGRKMKPYSRLSVLSLLGKIGPEAREAMPFIEETFREGSGMETKIAAAETILKIRDKCTEMEAFLFETMQQSDDRQCGSIYTRLCNLARKGRLSDPARLDAYFPILLEKIKQQKHPDIGVLDATSGHQTEIETFLTELLAHRDFSIRDQAAQLLRNRRSD